MKNNIIIFLIIILGIIWGCIWYFFIYENEQEIEWTILEFERNEELSHIHVPRPELGVQLTRHFDNETKIETLNLRNIGNSTKSFEYIKVFTNNTFESEYVKLDPVSTLQINQFLILFTAEITLGIVGYGYLIKNKNSNSFTNPENH